MANEAVQNNSMETGAVTCPHCGHHMVDAEGHRHKERTPEEVKALSNRLKRIEGQIRGLEGMLEDGAYCPDILVQVAAVTSALNGFSKELLTNHLKSCVVQDIQAGDEAAVDELAELLRKLMK